MDPAVDALSEEGTTALRSGDAHAARAAFQSAVALQPCGRTLEGLAEALHMVEDYGRESCDAYERAYRAYREERDALGAYRAARMIGFHHGAVLGDWALFHGWLQRASTLLEEVGGERQRGRLVLIKGQYGNADDAEKEALFREALAIGRQQADPDLEFLALAYLGAHIVHATAWTRACRCSRRRHSGAGGHRGHTPRAAPRPAGPARGGRATPRRPGGVGADGRHSVVAKAAKPEQYNERPALAALYYAYWSGVPTAEFEVFIRERRGFAAWPTNDDLTLIVGGWPEDEFRANRGDVEGNFLEALRLAPAFAERVRAGTRETRFWGTVDLRGYFRKPYGAGWGLVGDAGYHKHPITAMGMTDAFIDGERIAAALDESFSGRQTFDEAMGFYQKTRDAHAMAMYDMTCQFASLEAPPPEMQQLLAAVSTNDGAMTDFVSVQAGTLPVQDFFDPDNVGRIMAPA